MKVFTVFHPYQLTNTYIISEENEKDAILIDPGKIDINLLNLIEKNGYYIKHVLLTHSHPNHTQGITTLLKIYDAEIHGMMPIINGIKISRFTGETVLELSKIKITVIPVPGHSDDSVIYMIDNMLFTGDTIKTGYTGSTIGLNRHKEMIDIIKNKILSLKGCYLIFPGHGAPSTLESERESNLMLK